jgi:YtkA-like
MMFKVGRICSAMIGAFLLVGCGNADADSDPFRDVVGNAGRLHFQVDAEKPVSQGTNDLMISIYDASTHEAFMGAAVNLSATMPAMAHDTPTTTKVEEHEGGSYIASGLSLPMAGRWLIKLEASRQDIKDTVEVTYDLH